MDISAVSNLIEISHDTKNFHRLQKLFTEICSDARKNMHPWSKLPKKAFSQNFRRVLRILIDFSHTLENIYA